MPLSLNEMQRKIKESIYDEKEEASRRLKLPVAVRTGSEYEEMKALYPGETIFAVVGLMRCPWARCAAEFILAQFITKKKGEQFFFYCPYCDEMALTFKDIADTWGQNTYPVRELQFYMNKYPGRYQRWMNMLRILKDTMKEFQAVQPKLRERTLIGESRDNRAIKMRTSIVPDDEDDDLRGVGTRGP